MISNIFYNAYKQASMMICPESLESWQEKIKSPYLDETFDVLEEMETYYNSHNSLERYIQSGSITSGTRECMIIMEKILKDEI